MQCILKKGCPGADTVSGGSSGVQPPGSYPSPTGTGLKGSSRRAKQEPQGGAAELEALGSPPAGRGTRHAHPAL